MRTIVYITRHGLSEHNLETRFYMGRSPASRLVHQGREEARRLGLRLARGPALQRIVCSSLPRTVETARLIGAEIGLDSVEEEDAFWELSKGDWEGVMPREHLPPEVERALTADPFSFRYPNGESYGEVAERVGAAFERWVTAGDGQRLLFVLHGDVIRALLYHLLRFPPGKIGDFATGPCALTEFHREGGRWVLMRFNDESHLA